MFVALGSLWAALAGMVCATVCDSVGRDVAAERFASLVMLAIALFLVAALVAGVALASGATL